MDAESLEPLRIPETVLLGNCTVVCDSSGCLYENEGIDAEKLVSPFIFVRDIDTSSPSIG